MKVRIKETGEIVEVEYDDDDLYVVLGRHQYLYANEFEIVTPLSDDAVVTISKLREILEQTAKDYNAPQYFIDEIINRVKESI